MSQNTRMSNSENAIDIGNFIKRHSDCKLSQCYLISAWWSTTMEYTFLKFTFFFFYVHRKIRTCVTVHHLRGMTHMLLCISSIVHWILLYLCEQCVGDTKYLVNLKTRLLDFAMTVAVFQLGWENGRVKKKLGTILCTNDLVRAQFRAWMTGIRARKRNEI